MESKSPASPGSRARKAEFLLAASALAALVSTPARAQAPITGDWLTQDLAGIVRIAPCGQDLLCGTVVGISDFPPGGLRDTHGNRQCGLTIVHGLHAGADGRHHGTITNPDDDRTYQVQVWVPEDGILRLRGFVGLPLFGSTQKWPPFHGTLSADCHFRRN